jgi:lysophospholipase L1-like esterase
MKRISHFVFLVVTLSSIFNTLKSQSQSMTYLALGDSYTVGEAVPLENSWPHKLVYQLQSDGFDVQEPKIIAITGWRTDELIAAVKDQKKDLDKHYDIVSLLIGVNNQYQKKNISKYKREFKKLIKIGLSKSKYGAEGVFIVSIPDYGVSDFAKEEKLEHVAKEVAKYNKVAAKIAMKYGITFYDITPVSKTTEGDQSMFAEDKLHPSAKQYQLWLDIFYEEVKAKLAKLNSTE